MQDESAPFPETLNNAKRRRVCTSLRGVARFFVTGQCVKYQSVMLTQMVIWFTVMLETKAPRRLNAIGQV